MRRMLNSLLTPLSVIAALSGTLAGMTRAQAETWPARHMTLVVPFGAGSASDTLARIIGARVSELLAQQVIVENVGGAGGMVGVSRVAKAAPDGYTFVLGGVDTFAQNQTLYKAPLYNAATDFAPVTLVAEQALILVARKDMNATDMKQFAAYLKANQGKAQYASSGAGSASHLTCAQITIAVGSDAAHVAYRGSAPAIQDLLSGRIDYYCALAAAAMPHIEAKSLTAIATLTHARSTFLPDLPTAREQGFDILDSYFWSAFFLPKGTPDEIVTRLRDTVSTALDTPAVQARLREFGAAPAAPDRRTPAFLKTFVQNEIDKWAVTIKASGVTLN